MGKYMRKAKITGEVAVMEFAQSTLGVRTRAKTLALQRLQKTTTASTATPTTTNSESCYLQLRSRRLEKPPLLVATNESKRQQSKVGIKENPNHRTSSRLDVGSVGSVSLSCSKNEEGLLSKETKTTMEEGSLENNGLCFEASFGENVLEIEGRDRSTRETTPCSMIRDLETVCTPGSTTRPTSRRIQNAMRGDIPMPNEMEEFFADAEKQQQRMFTEKYNFDPVTESPLPGRYEWERVNP